MSKIIVSEFVTINNVMEAPIVWSPSYWSEENAKYKKAELFSFERLLLGRITYQGFAAAWPDKKDEEGYADRINTMPKYVVSETLKNAEWNNSAIINKDIFEEIKNLKNKEGDTLIFGSSDLVNSLIKEKLIDEVRLMIYPVVVGKGKKVFKDGLDVKLELLQTQTFKNGIMVPHYKIII